MGDRIPYLFVLAALVWSAAALGRGPSLLILAAGAVGGVWLSQPAALAAPRAETLIPLLAYLATGALFVIFGNRLRFSSVRAAVAEERLRLAQDETGVGVFELDYAAGIASVSTSLCQLLGQPAARSPMPLERWLAMLHPSHVENSRQAVREMVARGDLRYEREQRIELANGEARWLLFRVRVDLGPDGAVARTRGAAMDITAHKRLDVRLHHAQAELRQHISDLERLHALGRRLAAAGGDPAAPLQALLDLVVDMNGARHGVLSLCDEGGAALPATVCTGFGAQAGDVVSAAAAQPAAGNAEAAVPAYHRRLGEAQGLSGVRSTPLIGTSGEVMGAISVLFPEARAPSERETRLSEVCAATAAAVVERQRAQAAAAQTEKRFEVTLDSSTVPFTIMAPVRDAAGRVVDFRWTYLNPAAALTFAREARHLVGRRVSEIFPNAWDQPGLLEHYAGVVEGGEACEFESRSNVTGRGGWYHMIASPLQGSMAVWFTNITERKRQEAALREADRRKDEFLAVLAHELRNPLAPIRQCVQIARSKAAGEPQREWAHGVIDRQVHNMSLLLDDLLDVSRITRGTLLLRRSVVGLNGVIEAALETARPHVEAKGHRLRVSLPEQPVSLEIDPLRMSQVLGNLLTNAAKYTDPGGHIVLDARMDADAVVIRVTDDGIGLRPDHLDRLFEMFAQIDDAKARSQGGLGIGLAMSRGLVELHGGRLTARSAGAGLGSEFTVRLPAECCALRVESAPAAARGPARPSDAADGLHMLIADDNADAADSLAALLRMQGHVVHVAYDGETALAAFHRFEPHAALLDLGMPRGSGLDVARAIRRSPAGARAILIAVTGWGQERDRRDALEAGFDHHATKPMDPLQLQAMLSAGRAASLRRSN